MPKTVIEKIPSTSSGVTVFKVGGTLGFHEKKALVKLFEECDKRGISKLVMDFSELKSLGGGCAQIIREKAELGDTFIGVAGASKTTKRFLQVKGKSSNIHFGPTVEDVLGLVVADSTENITHSAEAKISSPTGTAKGISDGSILEDVGVFSLNADDELPGESTDNECLELVDDSNGGDETGKAEPSETETIPDSARKSPQESGAPGVIYLGHDSDDSSSEDEVSSSSSSAAAGKTAGLEEEQQAHEKKPGEDIKSLDKELKQKLIQYNSLLSVSSAFNQITDKAKLLDAFLLTTIAQVGVERAAFFELKEHVLVPVAAKGVELERCISLNMKGEGEQGFSWEGSDEVIELAATSIEEDGKNNVGSLGFSWLAPVIVFGEFRGMVLIGKPIKKSLNADSLEIFKTLVLQVAIAYENTRRFKEEAERTLGLVQTLVSLIEENTLTRGNTELIANYSFILAKKMHYPEEQIRDLAFGVVLRDIGMIKVSDLIIRSPRALVKEEWEIIKRHPITGVEMLKKMGFSEHVVKIVLYHHERYNGEGYPEKLRGSDIPLGARIVSVVESYGAMLQDRPTRPALTREEALNTLRENWEMRYDPEVIRHFVEVVEEEIRTGKTIRDPDSELLRL